MANELQLNDDQLSLLVAQTPDAIPRLWKKDVLETSATEDVFERMTGGPNSGMPFIWEMPQWKQLVLRGIAEFLSGVNGFLRTAVRNPLTLCHY